MKSINLQNLIRKMVEAENLIFKSLLEISESELQSLEESITGANKIEIDVTIPLELTNALVNDILNFMLARFGININIIDYEIIKNDISKALLETMLIIIRKEDKIDIVKTYVLIILEILGEYEPDIGKISDIYLYKELHAFMLERILEIQTIRKELIMNNSIIINIIYRIDNVALVPFRWLIIEPTVLIRNKTIEKKKTILKSYLINIDKRS